MRKSAGHRHLGFLLVALLKREEAVACWERSSTWEVKRFWGVDFSILHALRFGAIINRPSPASCPHGNDFHLSFLHMTYSAGLFVQASEFYKT